MKFNYFNLILIVIAFTQITSCVTEKKEITKYDLIGNWAFIENDSSYGEMYVTAENLSFNTDLNGNYGDYTFNISQDSLKYHFFSYKIILKSYSNITLVSDYKKYYLERIDINNVIKDTTYYNPYYLRRCNYLVNKGKISMREAVVDLCGLSSAHQ